MSINGVSFCRFDLTDWRSRAAVAMATRCGCAIATDASMLASSSRAMCIPLERLAYHDGLRISDVIHSADELRPMRPALLLIRRELRPIVRIVVVSADLDALSRPRFERRRRAQASRHVMVFDLQSSRDRVIQPLLDD